MSDCSGGGSSDGDCVQLRAQLSPPAMADVPTAQLHQWIRPTIVSSKKPLSNWGGSFQCTPRRLFAPTSVQECCAIVELARRIGGIEVRAMGRSHSPGDIVFTKDWIIRMDGVRGVLSIDHFLPSFTALAGTYLSDIHTRLETSSPPLSMLNVGSISEQTIAGLISTATHGTGIKQPVISAAVQSLRIACPLSTAHGGTQILTCSRTENADIFNATLCGLGATGLIVEVTMQVDHLFKLKQVSEDCSFDFIFGPRTYAPKLRVTIPTTGREDLPKDDYSSQCIGKLLAHGHRLMPAEERYLPKPGTGDASQVYPVSLDDAVRYNLDEDDETTIAAQQHLEAIAKSSQFVRMAWFPTVGVVTVSRADRTLEPFQTPSLLSQWHHQIIGHRLTELLLYVSRIHPSLSPRINRTIHYLTAPSVPSKRTRKIIKSDEASPALTLGSVSEEPLPSSSASPDTHLSNIHAFGSGGIFKPLELIPSTAATGPEPLDPQHPHTTLVDTSYRVFNIDCLFKQYTNEWAIPLLHAASAIRAMRDWIEEEERMQGGERVHFPVEIRFADGDGIWLSHCQGRKTCFIGLTMYRPYNRPVRYRSLFSKFEKLMRHYAGRPHWAKAHSCGPVELQRLYPHLPDFVNVMKRVDPQGVFRNPYVRRHLLGDLSDEASPRLFKSHL